MQLVFETAVGKIIVQGGVCIFEWSGAVDYAGACIGLAQILEMFLVSSHDQTYDELDDALHAMQMSYAEKNDYEKVATCRSARMVIANVVAHNENLRETVQ